LRQRDGRWSTRWSIKRAQDGKASVLLSTVAILLEVRLHMLGIQALDKHKITLIVCGAKIGLAIHT
jgi:hypothetical protein